MVSSSPEPEANEETAFSNIERSAPNPKRCYRHPQSEARRDGVREPRELSRNGPDEAARRSALDWYLDSISFGPLPLSAAAVLSP